MTDISENSNADSSCLSTDGSTSDGGFIVRNGTNGGCITDNNNDTIASSGSSVSHESSTSSFNAEKLYEINDDPKRKEFLDDLFSFMQKRGTPINRLPIMAKSVLDLYELYNLVIARGGLVDVINKKLWQEIIKGLHLPSSITSAAFTLRTQYMKYLYPYECEKQNLSSPTELQSAIDGNRREGRRSGYSQYDVMSRSGNPAALNPMAQISQIQQMQLNRMTTAMAAQGMYFPGMGISNGVHPSHPQPMSQPTNGGPIPGLAPHELEARMIKYVGLFRGGVRGGAAARRVASVRNGVSPPNPASQSLHPYEVSRMALWSMYNNNQPTPEPQKEALNLANGTTMPSVPVKNEPEESADELTPTPRRMRRSEPEEEPNCNSLPSSATNVKIDTQENPQTGNRTMVVSMELNGIKYQGVLFAETSQTTDNRTPIIS